MLFTILSFITGLSGTVSNIVSSLNNLKIAQVNAAAEETKAAIQQQIDAVHDKAAVLTAEVGQRLAAIVTACVQTLLALPVAVFLWKVIIWDKVIGSWPTFTTEMKNTDQLWWVIISVIGFYFVTIFRK